MVGSTVGGMVGGMVGSTVGGRVGGRVGGMVGGTVGTVGGMVGSGKAPSRIVRTLRGGEMKAAQSYVVASCALCVMLGAVTDSMFFGTLSGKWASQRPRPYVLVIATLTGPTAIAFDSEKSCLMASAEIRQVYAVAPAFKCVEK